MYFILVLCSCCFFVRFLTLLSFFHVRIHQPTQHLAHFGQYRTNSFLLTNTPHHHVYSFLPTSVVCCTHLAVHILTSHTRTHPPSRLPKHKLVFFPTTTTFPSYPHFSSLFFLSTSQNYPPPTLLFLLVVFLCLVSLSLSLWYTTCPQCTNKESTARTASMRKKTTTNQNKKKKQQTSTDQSLCHYHHHHSNHNHHFNTHHAIKHQIKGCYCCCCWFAELTILSSYININLYHIKRKSCPGLSIK